MTYRNGAPVRLSDIAKVTEGIEDVRNSGFSNGEPAVVIGIGRQPGANIIETVDRINGPAAGIARLGAAVGDVAPHI